MSVGGGGAKEGTTQPAVALKSDSSTRLSQTLKGPLEPENVVRWNSASLGLRLGADASSAATASILVAPLISVIDRSIVQKAASGDSFSSCLRRALRPAITRPHTYIASKPFLLIFGLYFSTYMTANCVDTLTSMVQSKSASTVSSGAAKFVATSAVNMSVCVYKDTQFAKMFGGGPATARIPTLSYCLFATRDSLTIFASFILPSLIGPELERLPPQVKDRFGKLLSTEAGRNNTAQFLTPAAMQIFSTPIHLLGLDLYNRQGKLGLQARVVRVTRDWAVSAVARMGRIVPAFGVGGVVNANMRRSLMSDLEA